jgi:hypothetical protein
MATLIADEFAEINATMKQLEKDRLRAVFARDLDELAKEIRLRDLDEVAKEIRLENKWVLTNAGHVHTDLTGWTTIRTRYGTPIHLSPTLLPVNS